MGQEKILVQKPILGQKKCLWSITNFDAWKKFEAGKNSRSNNLLCEKILSMKKIWPEKILGSKNLEQETLCENNFGSKNDLGPNEFWVQRVFGKKRNPFKNDFMTKEILGLKKNLGSQKTLVKTLGQKNFGSKTVLGAKRFLDLKNFC